MVLNPNQRFARMYQVDPAHPGTAVQRQALYDSLVYNIGSKYDYLNWRLARAVKKTRPFIPLGFWPNMTYPSLSSPAGINFSDQLDVAGVKHFALHETGWLVNHYLLTEADKQWFMAELGVDNFGIPVQEQFAIAVHEWILGDSWAELDPILLRFDPTPVPDPTVDPQMSPIAWGARVNYDTKTWRPWNPDKLVVHYEGSSGVGNSTIEREMSQLRAHEAYHIDGQGWLGLAYNYAIGNSGTLYRVRGENRSGATSGDEEPDGIPENHEARAYLFLIGGTQQPSVAAKYTFHREWLRWGQMRVTVHSDSTSTACPGDALRTWIKSGAYKNEVQ